MIQQQTRVNSIANEPGINIYLKLSQAMLKQEMNTYIGNMNIKQIRWNGP